MQPFGLQRLALLILVAASGCEGLTGCSGNFVFLTFLDGGHGRTLHPGDIAPVVASLNKGGSPQDECDSEYTSYNGSGFEWYSTNPSVATQSDGAVRAHNVGTAIIYARAKGVADSVTVVVTAPTPDPVSALQSFRRRARD
jgi:hypothetical protein